MMGYRGSRVGKNMDRNGAVGAPFAEYEDFMKEK
jgi:hypothetical protein